MVGGTIRSQIPLQITFIFTIHTQTQNTNLKRHLESLERDQQIIELNNDFFICASLELFNEVIF